MKNKTFTLERRRDKCAFCTRPQNYPTHLYISPIYTYIYGRVLKIIMYS